MRIRIAYCLEDCTSTELKRIRGQHDFTEVVGDIRLESDDGFVEEKAAYLDSWLDCLTAAVSLLELQTEFEIDLIEEPLSLGFATEGKMLVVSYGEQRLRISNGLELQHALEAIEVIENGAVS